MPTTPTNARATVAHAVMSESENPNIPIQASPISELHWKQLRSELPLLPEGSRNKQRDRCRDRHAQRCDDPPTECSSERLSTDRQQVDERRALEISEVHRGRWVLTKAHHRTGWPDRQDLPDRASWHRGERISEHLKRAQPHPISGQDQLFKRELAAGWAWRVVCASLA